MQIVVAQTKLIQIASAIIFDEHIGHTRQLADDFLPFRWFGY